MSEVGTWLLKGAFGLFLFLYIYAAAAFGLTRSGNLIIFQWAMGFTIILWLIGYSFKGQFPRTGIMPWVFSAAVLGFGWFVTAMGAIDEQITDGALASWGNWVPTTLRAEWSSYDSKASCEAMIRTTVLLGAMLMAIDFWSNLRRSRTLLLTMILLSFAMVLLFFLQRIVGSPFVLMSEDGTHPLSFATFRYHGNGASFLNLFWPIAASVAVFSAFRQTIAWPIWCIPLAATLLATFINISKAGNVLALVGLGILLATLIPFITLELKRLRSHIQTSRVLVGLVPVIVIAVSVPFALPWKRWNYYAKTSDTGYRTEAYSAFATKMIPDAGKVGFGPGTFKEYHLSYVPTTSRLGNQPYWVAHQDYIQTVAEWGYIGAMLWGALLIPPVFFLFQKIRKPSKRRSREFEGYRIGIWDHFIAFIQSIPSPREACVAAGALTAVLLTALHSMVDFPMQIASLQFYFLTLLALGWSYRLPEDVSIRNR